MYCRRRNRQRSVQVGSFFCILYCGLSRRDVGRLQWTSLATVCLVVMCKHCCVQSLLKTIDFYRSLDVDFYKCFKNIIKVENLQFTLDGQLNKTFISKKMSLNGYVALYPDFVRIVIQVFAYPILSFLSML